MKTVGVHHLGTGAAAAVLLTVIVACAGTSPRYGAATPDDDADGRRLRTGAVATMASHEMAGAQYAGTVEEMIAGRFAGVHVSRNATGDFSLRIRGTSTLRGDGEPLYVIDGVRVRGGAVRRPLAAVHPRDV
ncbi:MAG TPA: TonB-dependent receptor plug domain-containing protein, partial [Gemmatimonadaceae bacterium]|nr:TonB-dependent receptor plug domain-containing protein [Gemmatimonadaceae bacterium]